MSRLNSVLHSTSGSDEVLDLSHPEIPDFLKDPEMQSLIGGFLNLKSKKIRRSLLSLIAELNRQKAIMTDE